MHLLTAYFEHAYQISDDFAPPDHADYAPDQRDAYLHRSTVLDAGTSDELPAPFLRGGTGAQESPADVLARLQALTDSLSLPDPAPPATSLHSPLQNLYTLEDAKDVLARVHRWAGPQTSGAVGAGSPPVGQEGQEGQEDVASILARVQSMTSKYMTSAPCAQATGDTARLAPPLKPSVDGIKQEDPREVLARVNVWLSWTDSDAEAASGSAKMGSAETSNSAIGPALSAPLLQPPAAAWQEDAASILARAQGMAEALVRATSSSQSTNGHDAQAPTRGGAHLRPSGVPGKLNIKCAAGLGAVTKAEDVNRVLERVDRMMSKLEATTAEDVNRVLERVDCMMSKLEEKLEEKHPRSGHTVPGQAVRSAQDEYGDWDVAAAEAAALCESPGGVLSRANILGKGAISSWARSPTPAAAPSLPVPTCDVFEAAAEAEGKEEEDANTVLARVNAWISPDAPALAASGVAAAGGSLGDAGGAARDESVADVLLRVDQMMASMEAMGSGSADKAGIGEVEAEEEGWRDGRWARERTLETCCSWEMQIVLRQQQQQQHIQ